MLLEALGYKVFMARSGQEALEVYKARKEEIHLVIMDMIMPGMGGENAIDILKTINPELKVILSWIQPRRSGDPDHGTGLPGFHPETLQRQGDVPEDQRGFR